MDAKSYPKAISYFLKTLKLNPTDRPLYSLMGEAYVRSGDFRNAITQHKKALQFDPGDNNATQNLARSYNNLAAQLTRTGHWQEAIEACNRSFDLTPGLAAVEAKLQNIHWQWANSLRDKSDTDGTIKAYRRVLELNPNAVDGHSMLGDLYLKKRDYPTAVAHFQAALQADTAMIGRAVT